MVKQHFCFSHPTGDTKIWRYMDFSKFVSLITTSKLYCPNATTFDDALEGTYPAAQLNKQLKELQGLFGTDGGRDVHEGVMVLQALEQVQAQDWMYISCWHMNEYESAAMWKLYAKSSDAIAIQTTFQKLCESIGDEVPNANNKMLPVYAC